MCNGATKQVSVGVAPCNMVGLVKLFRTSVARQVSRNSRGSTNLGNCRPRNCGTREMTIFFCNLHTRYKVTAHFIAVQRPRYFLHDMTAGFDGRDSTERLPSSSMNSQNHEGSARRLEVAGDLSPIFVRELDKGKTQCSFYEYRICFKIT